MDSVGETIAVVEADWFETAEASENWRTGAIESKIGKELRITRQAPPMMLKFFTSIIPPKHREATSLVSV